MLDRFSLEAYQATNLKPPQEDRWVAQPFNRGYLLAVLDGHINDEVSDQAANRLAHYFQLGFERELPHQQRADAAWREEFLAGLTPEAIQAWIAERGSPSFEFDLWEMGLDTATADDNEKLDQINQLAQDYMADNALAEHRGQSTIDDSLRATVTQLVEDFGDSTAGSTLSMAYIRPLGDVLHIHTAQLGDSAIAILTPEGELHVTADHSVQTCESDRAVIQNEIDRARFVEDHRSVFYRAHFTPAMAPAYLMNDYGDLGVGLAMTRALGDANFEDLLIREPELQDFTVPRESLIFGMTDGVHNAPTLEGRHAAYQEIVEAIADGVSIELIGTDLVTRETLTDNITIVILGPMVDPRPIVATLDVWQDGDTAYVLTENLPEDYRDDIRVAGLFDPRARVNVDGGEGMVLSVVRRFERRLGIRFEYEYRKRRHCD